ncbi:MAG: hypothetical protein JRF63_06470 [Deltaproteobacteria bacterium]|nr:hypothetical protein [Deltaproteobacteria bacterium]
MTNEIKMQIDQLVEMNRALAHDLDLSHRIVAELSGERDSLREHVERLESGIKSRGEALRRSETLGAGRMTNELGRWRREAEELDRRRNAAVRQAEEADLRTHGVEQRLRELTLRFGSVEEERDDFRLQLGEMTEAMDEIRLRLGDLSAVDSCETFDFDGAMAAFAD